MLRKTSAKLALYDVNWQVLRVSLKGSWGDVSGARSNCNKLKDYIGEAREEGNVNEYATRLWRAVNLLNAVRMGFGSQLRGTKADMLVEKFRDSITQERGKFADIQLTAPSVRTILSDWRSLDHKTQQEVLTDLREREAKSRESSHRNELRWFVDLLETGKDKSEDYGLEIHT